jgi:hypothetical protein
MGPRFREDDLGEGIQAETRPDFGLSASQIAPAVHLTSSVAAICRWHAAWALQVLSPPYDYRDATFLLKIQSRNSRDSCCDAISDRARIPKQNADLDLIRGRIFWENRGPPRIKSGAGFFRKILKPGIGAQFVSFNFPSNLSWGASSSRTVVPIRRAASSAEEGRTRQVAFAKP